MYATKFFSIFATVAIAAVAGAEIATAPTGVATTATSTDASALSQVPVDDEVLPEGHMDAMPSTAGTSADTFSRANANVTTSMDHYGAKDPNAKKSGDLRLFFGSEQVVVMGLSALAVGAAML